MQRTQQSQTAEASSHDSDIEPSPGEAQSLSLMELVVGGRRYRLVPVAEPNDSPARAGRPGASSPPALRPSPAAQVLTARELEIVSLVAEGRVNKEIADRLGISVWTVSTHLRRIFAKLDVDTRAAMVSRCFDLAGPREP